MSDFQYFNVSIRGLAPGLLMSNGQMADPQNWYYLRAQDLRGKVAAGEEVERQIVRYHITGRLYVNAAKQVVLPSEMFSAVLRKGATSVNLKNGRKWWAGLTVTDDAPLIVDDLPAWDEMHADDRFVHRCMARDAKGGPQPRYRPYFRRWAAVVPVEIDPTALDKNTLEAIFRAAGRSVGVGDWRPSSPKNPGKYGRFQVESVVAAAEAMPLAA